MEGTWNGARDHSKSGSELIWSASRCTHLGWPCHERYDRRCKNVQHFILVAMCYGFVCAFAAMPVSPE